MVCSQKVHLGRRNTCSCLLLQVRRSCTNCDSIHGDTAVLRTPNWAATLFDNSKFIGSINGAAETLFVWICLNCARSSPNWRRSRQTLNKYFPFDRPRPPKQRVVHVHGVSDHESGSAKSVLQFHLIISFYCSRKNPILIVSYCVRGKKIVRKTKYLKRSVTNMCL